VIGYLPIPGTHDWDPPDDMTERWWAYHSRFTRDMRAEGFERLGPKYPLWNAQLTGTFFSGPALRSWWHGAYVGVDHVLAHDIPVADRNFVGFSHGGNVAYLIATMIPVNSIVDVGTPVRKDMAWAYRAARCRKLHVYSTGWENKMQLAGQLMDREVRWRWENADTENLRLEGTAHGDLLRKAELFPMFRRHVLPWIEEVHA
jgi:hypothetical protein